MFTTMLKTIEVMETKSIFDNWENVPVEVKKEIARKRKAALDKYQGSVTIKDPKYIALA